MAFNYLSTMKSFCRKNGYDYYIDGSFMYIRTTNDRFKVNVQDLLACSETIHLYHENEGVGWHKQCGHDWEIKQMQKHIWEHDGLMTVHAGRHKVVRPSNREDGVQYGWQFDDERIS